jgi:hypothetical protein
MTSSGDDASWAMAIWAAAGLLVGVLHAVGLWTTTRRLQERAAKGAAAFVLRVAGVGMLFLFATLTKGLLPAAIGWGVGFPFAGILLLRRHSL